jgi:hypothetical protein
MVCPHKYPHEPITSEEKITMRYRDFASDQPTTHEHRCNVATLYVLDHEWSELKRIRQTNAPTRITAVRSLAPRFEGFSVDIVCSSPDAAIDLLVAWCWHPASHDGSTKAEALFAPSSSKS